MRNKLIELLDAFRELENPHDGRSWTEHFADHLIAGGVVILDPKKYPPIKNGAIIRTICGEPLDDVANLIEAKREGRVIVRRNREKVGFGNSKRSIRRRLYWR